MQQPQHAHQDAGKGAMGAPVTAVMQPGMVMQPGPQGGLQMVPQPGMHPGLQAGVQYMQMILPMEQALKMAQNGGVVPVAKLPAAQAQAIMSQQGGKGGMHAGGMQKGGAAGSWGNQANQGPGCGGGKGGYGQGKGSSSANDDQLDDWFAKRMGKTSTSAPSAGDGATSSKNKQQVQQPQQMQPQLMQQQPMQQQPPMQPQPPPQQTQPQPQPQTMQQQMVPQLQMPQQQWWQPQNQWWSPQQSYSSHHPHGMQTGGSWPMGARWTDSPRTAAWREKLAKNIAESGNNGNSSGDVEEWIMKRSQAGPARKAPSGASAGATEHTEDEQPSGSVLSMEACAHVFVDARPWAEITDEDKTGEELMKIIHNSRGERHLLGGGPPADAPKDSVDQPHDGSASLAETVVASANEVPVAEVAPIVTESEPSTDAPPPSEESAVLEEGAAPDVSATAVKPAATASAAAVSSAPAKASEDVAAPSAGASNEATPAVQPPSANEKRKKALQKKLRQIEELEARQQKKEPLGPDQFAKMALRPSVEAELQTL